MHTTIQQLSQSLSSEPADHSLDRATATACKTLKDVTGAARPDGRMAVAVTGDLSLVGWKAVHAAVSIRGCLNTH